MNSKEKLIITKLLSVAERQQKTLMKLAQVTEADPGIVQYLKSAWQTAALNSGVTSVSSPSITFKPGSAEAEGVMVGENYMVTGECPADKREAMQKNLSNQIKSQKPELDGKVSTIFTDPTSAKAAGANMDSKKVIERLVRIAEKQQQIINKLAQTHLPTGGASSSFTDASSVVQSLLQQVTSEVGATGSYGVQSASMGNEGFLDVKLQYPSKLMGSPEVRSVREKLTALLKGKNVAGKAVTNVNVIGVPV